MQKPIPVYEPDLSGREREYVIDCVDSTWISSNGKYIDLFEGAVAEYTGIENAVAVFNGTVALHLAMQCLGIGPGDEVLVPTFTYIASVNSILTAGATPVLVESRPDDWLMDVDDLEKRITNKTKAIMAVHLYGFVCNMPAIREIADKHGLLVIEDAAEAMGVFIDRKHVGWNSDAATFSFFGNKTITCGEGGIVVTKSTKLADDMRVTKNHGMSREIRYWHDRLGFNYRMTNIQAAIGFAQMERIQQVVSRKQNIYHQYREKLNGSPLRWQETLNSSLNSSYWLISMMAQDGHARDEIRAKLANNNIDTRPVFHCAHKMPLLAKEISETYPIAESISDCGFSLPSYPTLQDDDIDRICDVIKSIV